MEFACPLSAPDRVRLETENNKREMSPGDQGCWAGGGTLVRLEKRDGAIEVFLSGKGEIIKRVWLSWKQEITGPVSVLGDAWERGYGDLEWRGMVPERVLPWYLLVHDGEITRGCGVKTGAGALCWWRFTPRELTLCLDVRCGGAGVTLGNRELHAAGLVFLESRTRPLAAARRLCSMMCGAPRMPASPVYGGNDWYFLYGNSSHGKILEHARLISQLSSNRENRPFMVVDDGWQLCRGGQAVGGNLFIGGPWDRANRKFPGGMTETAADIRALGARPGIWLRPLLTAEPFAPEDTRKMPSGEITLDPSSPRVLEKVEADARRLTEWGYELIKHDFSTYDIFGRWGFAMGSDLTFDGWAFADRGRTTAEIVTDFYRAIRRGAGENTLILGCNTIGHLAAGIFELQRGGDDTSGLDWERTRKMGVNTLAFRALQHGTFFAVDADCAGLTPAVDWEKNRQWLRLLSLSGTPLFASVAVGSLTGEEEKELSRALDAASVPRPLAEPLDWMYNTCPERWSIGGEEMTFDWNVPISGGKPVV